MMPKTAKRREVGVRGQIDAVVEEGLHRIAFVLHALRKYLRQFLSQHAVTVMPQHT